MVYEKTSSKKKPIDNTLSMKNGKNNQNKKTNEKTQRKKTNAKKK